MRSYQTHNGIHITTGAEDEIGVRCDDGGVWPAHAEKTVITMPNGTVITVVANGQAQQVSVDTCNTGMDERGNDGYVGTYPRSYMRVENYIGVA